MRPLVKKFPMTPFGVQRQHELYTDADPDRPAVICDSNGQVVLSLCKVCGKGEADLDACPTCPGGRDDQAS